jgi:hypothetical protein
VMTREERIAKFRQDFASYSDASLLEEIGKWVEGRAERVAAEILLHERKVAADTALKAALTRQVPDKEQRSVSEYASWWRKYVAQIIVGLIVAVVGALLLRFLG